MKRVAVADIEMAVQDEGAGTPLLLVHGFPLDHTMWDAQVAGLAGRARVIAPDLRGYGQSTLGDVGDPEAAPMERYADDLAAMLDALGVAEPVVFCGFSMGGYIGWQFLRRHGERVRGLVCCDTRAANDNDEARQTRLKMADHVQRWGSDKVAEAMEPKLFASATLEARPAIVQRTMDVICGTDPRAIAAAQRGMAARPDVSGDLPGVAAPTLVIVGAEDSISTVEETRAMAAAIPGAELVVIEGAGHMSPVEQPDAVTAALAAFMETI